MRDNIIGLVLEQRIQPKLYQVRSCAANLVKIFGIAIEKIAYFYDVYLESNGKSGKNDLWYRCETSCA